MYMYVINTCTHYFFVSTLKFLHIAQWTQLPTRSFQRIYSCLARTEHLSYTVDYLIVLVCTSCNWYQTLFLWFYFAFPSFGNGEIYTTDPRQSVDRAVKNIELDALQYSFRLLSSNPVLDYLGVRPISWPCLTTITSNLDVLSEVLPDASIRPSRFEENDLPSCFLSPLPFLLLSFPPHSLRKPCNRSWVVLLHLHVGGSGFARQARQEVGQRSKRSRLCKKCDTNKKNPTYLSL